MVKAKATNLADLFVPFKANEPNEQVLAMSSSQDVQRLVAVWPQAHLTFLTVRRFKGTPPTDLGKRWLWLWSHCDVDQDELSLSTGLSRVAADRALKVAVRNRLVYPDGTISGPASRLLAVLAARHLGVKEKGKK